MSPFVEGGSNLSSAPWLDAEPRYFGLQPAYSRELAPVADAAKPRAFIRDKRVRYRCCAACRMARRWRQSMKNGYAALAVGVLALALTACNQESQPETNRDVAKAQQEGVEGRRRCEQEGRRTKSRPRSRSSTPRKAEASADVAKANATASEKINDATTDANKAERKADSKDSGRSAGGLVREGSRCALRRRGREGRRRLQGRNPRNARGCRRPADELQGHGRSDAKARRRARRKRATTRSRLPRT